jgi:hypothetical protein
MHAAVATGVAEHLGEAAEMRTATPQRPEHGLTEDVLTAPDEPDVRRVADGVRWTRTDRPERTSPTVLRYDSGDVFTGHGYGGPLDAGR